MLDFSRREDQKDLDCSSEIAEEISGSHRRDFMSSNGNLRKGYEDARGASAFSLGDLSAIIEGKLK
jgi:hypothetical protein